MKLDTNVVIAVVIGGVLVAVAMRLFGNKLLNKFVPESEYEGYEE